MNNNSNTIYSLNRRKRDIISLKSNLNQIIIKLKSEDIGVSLDRAASSLNNNYIINNSQPRFKQIKDVSDNIDGIVTKLRNIINYMDSEIVSINNDLERFEDGNN